MTLHVVNPPSISIEMIQTYPFLTRVFLTTKNTSLTLPNSQLRALDEKLGQFFLFLITEVRLRARLQLAMFDYSGQPILQSGWWDTVCSGSLVYFHPSRPDSFNGLTLASLLHYLNLAGQFWHAVVADYLFFSHRFKS